MEIYFCIIWTQTLTCKSIAVDITLQILDPYSVQFSRSVVSDSLWPHELPNARPLSITNSRSSLKLMSIESIQPLHPLSSPSPPPSIFSSIRVFSNESILHIRWPKYSASVLPMNIQDWFPLAWTGWISLQSKGLSRVFSNTTVQKHQFFSVQLSS